MDQNWWARLLDILRRWFTTKPSTPPVVVPTNPPVVVVPDPPAQNPPPVVQPPVVTPPPPVTEPLPPVHRYPARTLNLSDWKVTLPVKADSGTGPKEVKQPALATFENEDWFHATPAGDGTVFRAPVNGVTTTGSKYPRSELRHMAPGGDWSSTEGTNTFEFTEAFTGLPVGKDQVVGAQLHDSANDITTFRLEGHNLYVTEGNNSNAHLIDSNYQLGTKFTGKYVAGGGQVLAFYNSKLVATIPCKATNLFWKLGCYTQANCTNSTPCSAANFGEVTVYDVKVTQGPTSTPDPSPAPSGPPVPVPTPVPTPTPAPKRGVIIQVSRHAEKDDNHDGADDNPHALSATGVKRAIAIRDRGLFTTPRPDLYVPGYIFASGPPPTRMVQTAQPTATVLGLPIDASLNSENAVTQTAQLLAKQATGGKVVWAVLEHSCIAAVASALVKTLGGKWNAKPPSSWADDDFSSIWKFVGDGAGNWVFSKTDEGVLPSDPGYTAPK